MASPVTTTAPNYPSQRARHDPAPFSLPSAPPQTGDQGLLVLPPQCPLNLPTPFHLPVTTLIWATSTPFHVTRLPRTLHSSPSYRIKLKPLHHSQASLNAERAQLLEWAAFCDWELSPVFFLLPGPASAHTPSTLALIPKLALTPSCSGCSGPLALTVPHGPRHGKLCEGGTGLVHPRVQGLCCC